MQIGTVRTRSGTRAARVDGGELVLLPESDVGELLRSGSAADAAGVDGERVPLDSADLAPLVVDPDKIICVGLNYHEHVREMGGQVPDFPTYFAKYRGALIGARDDIKLPPPRVSTDIDWEVELCIVIGSPARNVAAADALDHVAGYTILNDISVRDFQRRTGQFLAGKTFEAMTPVGPVMTTADVLGDGRGLAVSTTVDGEVKQSSTTDELVFGPAEIVSDLSRIITLEPGDLIATGTPSGVGAARKPPQWLSEGSEVVTRIDGIGELRNRCVIGP